MSTEHHKKHTGGDSGSTHDKGDQEQPECVADDYGAEIHGVRAEHFPEGSRSGQNKPYSSNGYAGSSQVPYIFLLHK
jgi:hypothetical protein